MTDWQPQSTRGNVASKLAPHAVFVLAALAFILWQVI